MKRFAASAGMLVLVAFGLVAAVWDGSAVAVVLGDFPGDDLYGACNSFPRDTSVTVTNLENGKTVTITITNGVDNPSVFIALSPKAAAALDMRAGSAARVRAVAQTASEAEMSLPPARAGKTADPDYNPQVYVEREKEAAKAAAAEAFPAAVAAAPSASPVQAPAAENPPAAASPETIAPEKAEVIGRPTGPSTQTPAAPPSLGEPGTVSAPPSAAGESSKIPADLPPLTEASPAIPGSPKPAPIGMSLPAPDLPSIPTAASPTPRNGYQAQAPEMLGGAPPRPRKPAVPRLAVSEPTLPTARVNSPEQASIDALAHPAPEVAPDQLPDAILSRVIAPSKVEPIPALAEARPPTAVAAEPGLEAIALERPSYAASVEAAELAEAAPVSPSEEYSAERPAKSGSEAAAAELEEAVAPGSPEALGAARPSPLEVGSAAFSLDEASLPGYPEAIGRQRPSAAGGPPISVSLDEATPPGTPEAIAYRRSVGSGEALTELSEPDLPTASESLAVIKPQGNEEGTAAALGEPDAVSPTQDPTGPVAIADAQPSPGQSPSAALGEPAVPVPQDSLGKPSAVQPSEAMVTLEPAEPRPPQAPQAPQAASAATQPPSKPAQPAAVATVKGRAPAGAAEPPASIPRIKGLAKGSFYVQIGVYGTNESLQTAINGFKPTYPLAVERVTTKSGGVAYRLFAGPLGRDESGVVLIMIRSLGFRDAYIRQGS